MKKILVLWVVVAGCVMTGCAKKEAAVIRIGEVTVTAKEFEAAYEASRFTSYAPEAGRRAFLDSLISKKLILREAEKLGLDKNPAFLQDIQMFWEQGLLKLVLAEKSKELAVSVEITPEEISAYYQRHKEADFPNKDLAQVQDEIKWLLLKGKQSKAMMDWVDNLRARTPVDIDYQALGIRE